MKASLTFILALIGGCHAFFGSKPATSTSSGKLTASPQADAAVAIFSKKFPFDRPPPKTSGFVKFGMPTQDIDGSAVFGKYDKPRRLTDISESDARAYFAELAKNYGADEALAMVKAQPICLSFQKKWIAPSLQNFSEIFGEEDAQKMVQRNPGLLAVNPLDAATVNDQTLVFSYIVAATRPLGPVLLSTVFLLLLTLPYEAATGISARAELMSFLSGQ